jgi:hypothetical protein
MDSMSMRHVFLHVSLLIILPLLHIHMSQQYIITSLVFKFRASPLTLHLAGEVKYFMGRAIAEAVSYWLPTAAVRGSSPGLVTWDLWWTK